MIDDAATRQLVERLKNRVNTVRREAKKVSIQCLIASLIPMSSARAGLKARHAALVKMADDAQAEIDRLHAGQP